MPRLEVESVADMKVLFEIGALTPDMSLQLSHIMMGEDIENKRRRIQLEQGKQGKQQGGALMRPEEIQELKGRKNEKKDDSGKDKKPGKDDKDKSGKDDKDKSGKDDKDKSDPKKHPPPLGGKK